MERQITLMHRRAFQGEYESECVFELRPAAFNCRVPSDTVHLLQSCAFEVADIWLQVIKYESSPNSRIKFFVL